MTRPQTTNPVDKFANEPRITINGTPLTIGQAMTLRVGMECFSMTLTEEGQPKDNTIEKHYLDNIRAIRKVMGYGI